MLSMKGNTQHKVDRRQVKYEGRSYTMGIAEMTEGYCDGRDPDTPEPGANRGAAYAHGFANGRDDLRNKPRASGQVLREQARVILGEAA